MTQEFVPYELAVKLKELGFDEPCFGYYNGNYEFTFFVDVRSCNTNSEFKFYPTAPTYSQAFRWFREKYDLFTHIEKGENPKNFYPIIDNVSHKYNPKLWFDTYEETELACLEKLIEIVESKSE